MGFLAAMTPVGALIQLAAGIVDNRATRRALAEGIDFARLLQQSLDGAAASAFNEMDTDGDNRIRVAEPAEVSASTLMRRS
ncbi:MAG: hypothetical protein IH843_03425 [Thaumarchaeota archaeon]|nr:hypothetical protein [Nitrososphaerota archaeon]